MSILIGISLTVLSTIFILKMLVRVQNKNVEVGNITSLIDKDVNSTYHLYSNLLITDITLILSNVILYFRYTFSKDEKYKNDYLYNEIGYDEFNYKFLKNIYYRTNEFFYEKSTPPSGFDSIKEWLTILYPFVFLFFLGWNVLWTSCINIIKTINKLITDFFNTIIYLFKLTSLITILVLSSINMYLSTTISTIHLKTKKASQTESAPAPAPAPASAINNNNSVFSQIGDIFKNLNLNYLTNSQLTL